MILCFFSTSSFYWYVVTVFVQLVARACVYSSHFWPSLNLSLASIKYLCRVRVLLASHPCNLHTYLQSAITVLLVPFSLLHIVALRKCSLKGIQRLLRTYTTPEFFGIKDPGDTLCWFISSLHSRPILYQRMVNPWPLFEPSLHMD